MHEEFLKVAFQEAKLGVSKDDGGPFGAVIVDSNGKIVSQGHNMVLATHDPTNHAEIVAIRKACDRLHTHDLSGCTIYSNCEPCPMCLSAIIWSNIQVLYYGAPRKDAAHIGFRDDLIYDFFEQKNHVLKSIHLNYEEGIREFNQYKGELY